MLDLADFALQEQPEENLMAAISRAWYYGSYTMAAKPIKCLQLHYTMIQFLIITIIPRKHVEYEMVDSKRGAYRRVSYNHLISNKRVWNNCFIQHGQEILLNCVDLADFALQGQLEDNLMVAISRACCNGSYIMAAKTIKSPEIALYNNLVF